MLRRSFLQLLAAAPLLAEAPAKPRVVIQPYEKEPQQEELAAAALAIQAFYAVDLEVRAPVQLPAVAWYGPNKRWRAEILLEHLRLLTAGDEKLAVVGVTSADISTTKGKVHDWGIMGLGWIGGGICVASTFRCGRGKGTTKKKKQQRFAKVVVHELGHALGSDHCSVAGCLMNDAKGTARTIDAERDFCGVTRMLFAGKKVPLVDQPVAPW